MIIRKAWNDLTQHKTKTLFTILGLAIAVISTTGFSIASNSITQSAENLYGDFNSPDGIMFFRDRIWAPSYVENITGLKDYELGYSQSSITEIGNESQLVIFEGFDIDRQKDQTSMRSLVLEEGRWPNIETNEIICDISAANALDLEIGDELSFSFNSKIDLPMTIVGLGRDVKAPGFSFNNYMTVWISMNQLGSLMGNSELFNEIYIQTEESIQTEDVLNDLVEKFKEEEIFVENVVILDETDDWRSDMLGIIVVISNISTIIGIFLGGILSASTIHMTISQERKDISLLKIIGGQRKHIFIIYVTEALILGLIGSILGLILSIGGSFIILNILKNPFALSHIEFVAPFHVILIGFLIPILSSFLFSIPIILKVLGIRPMEFFHGKSKIKKKQGRSSSHNMFAKYSLKNTTRSKGRFILTVFLMAFAIGTVFGFQVGFDSASSGLENSLYSFPPQILMDSSEPTNKSEVLQILNNYKEHSNYSSEIKEISPILWVGADIYQYDKANSSKINLLGIDTDANIFSVFDIYEGRWLTSSDANSNSVVITEKYSTNKAVKPIKVGENITLSNPMGALNFTVIGICSDINNGGAMVYAPLSTVQKMFYLEDCINMVYISLYNVKLDLEIAKDLSQYDPVKTRGFVVTSMTYWVESNKKLFNMLNILALLITILSIFVAVIGGINIFTMISLERQREIGILKIIGAKPKWIFGTFLTESLIIDSIACLFGMVFGYFIIVQPVYILTKSLMNMEIVFTVKAILFTVGTALITGILSPLFPGYRASKTSAIEGLRFE